MGFTLKLRIPLDKDGLLVLLVQATLKKAMGESLSGEANRFSTSQEIPRTLWNLIFHYRTHKSLSLSWSRSFKSTIQTGVRYILILLTLSTTRSSKFSFPQVSPPKLCMHISPPISATCFAHLILLDLIGLTKSLVNSANFETSHCKLSFGPLLSAPL